MTDGNTYAIKAQVWREAMQAAKNACYKEATFWRKSGALANAAVAGTCARDIGAIPNPYAVTAKGEDLDKGDGAAEIQEIYTELGQAEARIEELEAKLAKAKENLAESDDLVSACFADASSKNIAYAEANYRARCCEAKLAAKEKLMLVLAGDKIDLVSELAGVNGKITRAVQKFELITDIDPDRSERFHDIAHQAIAELKGQDDE